MDNDIEESKNVAASHPEIVAKLMKLAEEARCDLGDYDRIGTGPRFFDGPRPKKWTGR